MLSAGDFYVVDCNLRDSIASLRRLADHVQDPVYKQSILSIADDLEETKTRLAEGAELPPNRHN